MQSLKQINEKLILINRDIRRGDVSPELLKARGLLINELEIILLNGGY